MGSQVNSNKDMKPDLQQFIGTALRWGVSLACVVAVIGGVFYLIAHGAEPIPDYGTFHHESASYTTLTGIWEGVMALQAKELIQLGVLLLILTPVVRVALSLVTFSLERDWLYVGITAIVFLIIIGNAFSSYF